MHPDPSWILVFDPLGENWKSDRLLFNLKFELYLSADEASAKFSAQNSENKHLAPIGVKVYPLVCIVSQ